MSNKVQGMKVKLFVKDVTGTVLAGQKNATLNRSAENMEATSKDTVGGWKEFLAGMKEWSIDCDGAYVESDAAYATLETAFMDGTEVDVYVEFPSGTKYEGLAIVTDFPLEFPYDDLTTYSMTLQGTGALAKTTGA